MTPTTAGPETPFPANSARSAAPTPADIGLSRRPRELPWLITPPPSVNQAAAAAAAVASASSRRARPSTTPAATAGAADRGSGARGVTTVLSRSASQASATGGRSHPQQDEQQQQGRKRGTEGRPQTGTRAATAGAGAARGGSAPAEHVEKLSPPEKDHDDPEAEHLAAEGAAAATALASSEWARQRRQALVCAGSMEVPVGASSSASAGAGSGGGGGDAQPGSSAVVLFGLGSGSVGEESLSFGGRGGDVGVGRGSPLRGHGKASMVGRPGRVAVTKYRLHGLFEGKKTRDLASTVKVACPDAVYLL